MIQLKVDDPRWKLLKKLAAKEGVIHITTYVNILLNREIAAAKDSKIPKKNGRTAHR